MSDTLASFSIRLTSWDCWQIILDAESAEAAEAEALRIFSEDGGADFKHRGCGVDGIEVEERGPAEGGVQ